jgi:multiple sugar transport system substrate-binding protein
VRRSRLYPARRNTLVAGLALGMSVALAACGSSGGAPSASSTAHVTLQYWGWNDGTPAVVSAFNAGHPDVTIKYTSLTDAVDALTDLSNAVKAGNAPCLMQGSSEDLLSLVSEGIPADISQWVAPVKGDFSTSAYDYTTVEGKNYAVPTATSPGFLIYRADIFKKYGLTAPTTYSQFIADGKVLASHKVYITNFAGEDPSTLENMAMQAGAHWYSIDGNAWKVDFTDPDSLEAANVIQQIIDDGEDSQISFADYAAVQHNYDDGGTVTRWISTWQLAGMVKNFTESDGDWAVAPWTTYDGQSLALPAGINNGAGNNFVTKQCAYTAQAAEAAVWMGTNAKAVSIMANPTTGSDFYPALAQTAPYVSEIVPGKLLGSNTAAAAPVIVDSVKAIVTGWTFGPDWDAMGAELTNGWAKVMTKQETVVQLLDHMQTWTVNDLKSRGISVVS